MLYILSISHYRSAIGGEHYYGNIRICNGQGRNGFGEQRELRREIDAVEAEYLSQKDGVGDYPWEAGDTTIRFNTTDDVEKAAIKFFEENSSDHDTDILIRWDHPSWRFREDNGDKHLAGMPSFDWNRPTHEIDLEFRKMQS
jgi:hypothetical protein